MEDKMTKQNTNWTAVGLALVQALTAVLLILVVLAGGKPRSRRY